jgi:hypothetical protein
MRSNNHDDRPDCFIQESADTLFLADDRRGDREVGEALESDGSSWRARRTTVAVAIAATVAGAGALVATRHSSPVLPGLSSATAAHRADPSARQLADGHWLTTTFPPIPFAYPSTVWDGRSLVAFDGRTSFPAQAAAYHPQTNGWTTIASPPDAVGASPVGVWGGGRLILVARETGYAVSWRPSTNRWTTAPALPARGVVSLVWDGQHMVAITIGSHRAGDPGSGPQAHAFRLGGRRWIRLPDLPRPAGAPVRDAAAAVDDGAVYVLAAGVQVHQQARRATGSIELLRLDWTGWTRVPGATGLPVSQLSMASLTGALLVTGSACPEPTPCRGGYIAAIITPGRDGGDTVLKPPLGMPYPGNVTGGGRTVVVAAADRSFWIYDIATSKWRQGPTAAATVVPSGVYWTPYGVVTGGALLRPAWRLTGS